jgi:hypothetical protein
MQVFEESTATLSRIATVSALKTHFQVYTLVGGTVARSDNDSPTQTCFAGYGIAAAVLRCGVSFESCL